MPVQVYRCPNRHTTEQWFGWGKHPDHLACGVSGCGGVGKHVILPPEISVDHEDARGFNVGAGRYFGSRGERREWMRETGMMEFGPEDSAREAAARKDVLEAKADGVVI